MSSDATSPGKAELGSTSLTWGPAGWPVRVRGGLTLDSSKRPGLLGGLELPLWELESSQSNTRALGLVLRTKGVLTWGQGPRGSAGAFVAAGLGGPMGLGLGLEANSRGGWSVNLAYCGAVYLREKIKP